MKKYPKRKKKPSSAVSRITCEDLPELQHARSLWKFNRPIEALALFNKVAESHPRNLLALTDAGRAFGAMYQYERAEELLKAAMKMGARSADGMHLVGQSFRLIRRPQEAIDCFLAALKLHSGLADTHLELAILLERRGQLDAALESCKMRLKLLPLDPEATFLRARVLRRKQDFVEAENSLRQTATNGQNHWLTRARCYAELAALYDQLKNFELAWESSKRGNQLLQSHDEQYRRHAKKMLLPLQRVAEEITQADCEQWVNAVRAIPSEKPRTVLMTGLPRSGTTLLARMLDAHLQIAMADEFDVFPRIGVPMILEGVKPEDLSASFLTEMSDTKIDRLRKSYRTLLTAALPASKSLEVLIDKNPSLLPLIPLYNRLFPDEPLIVVLRDPRDVLVSCLMAYMPLNDFSVDFLTLENAVARIKSELGSWISLRQKLPQTSWIEVRYEELVHDWRAATAGLLQKLNLPWSESISDYRDASGSNLFSRSYPDVVQPVYTHATGRWKNYSRHLEAFLPELEALSDQLFK